MRRKIRRPTAIAKPSFQAKGGFLSLATELLQMICDKIEKDDIYNIRLVCKQLNTAVAPRFFSHVIINVVGGKLTSSDRLLSIICDNESLTASFARTLEIRSLPASPGRIALAISYLTNVSTVFWKLSGCESDQAISHISSSISSLPNLDSFSVTLPGDAKADLPVDKLTNLRRLSFSNDFERMTFSPYISTVMPILITNNPDLTHLDVIDSIRLRERTTSLHEILGETSESNGPPLQLQHLGLRSCATHLDQATLRHLKSLTSLTLHNHPRAHGPDSHYVWGTLLSEGVRLTALNTDCMDGKLLNYLASFSGLKILKLQSLADVDDLANRFFHDILPHHADTLETLCLNPQYEGPWCLGSGTLDSVLLCHKLVELAFSIEFDFSTAAEEKWEKEIEIHPVVSMFNQLTHLPHLSELKFLSANTRRPIDYFILEGTKTYPYRVIVSTRKAIRRFLPEYGVHPHVVTSAGLDYKLAIRPEEEGGKSYLRYCPCGSEKDIKWK